jgi:hypothetical protein
LRIREPAFRQAGLGICLNVEWIIRVYLRKNLRSFAGNLSCTLNMLLTRKLFPQIAADGSADFRR